MQPNFHIHHKISNKQISVAVIFAKFNNEWLMCRHKDRDTWEIPGGHIEKDENLIDGAKRELYEESGAIAKEIKQICFFSTGTDLKKYGVVYFADIERIEKLPNFEIKEIKTFKEFPTNVTYKETYDRLFPKVKDFKGTNE